MTTTAIFNNFKQADFWRNKFTRGSSIFIKNANLHHGDIRPFACPEIACEGAGNLQTLYPLPDCKCFGFDYRTDIVRGFCQDQHFYLDESGTLIQATEDELCRGTLPCKAGAPFNPVAPTATSGCDEQCDAVGVSYVVTYVTEHAGIHVESAPSPASVPVASNGHIPKAAVSWSTPPEGYCIVETRLYRVESNFEDATDALPSQGAEYVFVASFKGTGVTHFIDDVPTDKTGYPLTTYDPMAFPAPGHLVGLARTEDGIVVADEHRVYISETGRPQFTWDGVVEIEDAIRAIRAIGNTIFVLTDNKPVKLGYRHVDGAMSIDRQVVDRRLPLCSEKSVSVYDQTLYFGSTFSLYRWNTSARGNDLDAALMPMLTPEQWKAVGCDTVRGVGHELGYMLYSDKLPYSLMIEFEGGGADTVVGSHIMPIDYIKPDAFALDYDGHIVYQEEGNVYGWDYRRGECESHSFEIEDHIIPSVCDQCECCEWEVWLYIDNEGKNRFSKMRVEFDERSTSHIDVAFLRHQFGNEETIAEVLRVIRSRGFSIPKFYASQTFMVKLTGCGILNEVRLATSYQELVNSSNNQLER